MIAISEGWSNIVGFPGIISLGITSICKLCFDVTSKIIEKNQFILWCEIAMIVCNAVYLMGVLLIRHDKEANLWIVIGIMTLTYFILGCLLKKLRDYNFRDYDFNE